MTMVYETVCRSTHMHGPPPPLCTHTHTHTRYLMQNFASLKNQEKALLETFSQVLPAILHTSYKNVPPHKNKNLTIDKTYVCVVGVAARSYIQILRRTVSKTARRPLSPGYRTKCCTLPTLVCVFYFFFGNFLSLSSVLVYCRLYWFIWFSLSLCFSILP